MMAMFEVMNSGSWYNRFPGEARVKLDLIRLVTFYDTSSFLPWFTSGQAEKDGTIAYKTFSKWTTEAIGKSCQSLIIFNLNYTSVLSTSLLGPLTSCTDVKVLKMAGIPNWVSQMLLIASFNPHGITINHYPLAD
jgi:hypothetical protein